MPLETFGLLSSDVLRGRSLFLSASIPRTDWEGEYDALEITDAVVAATRAIFGSGGRLVYGAHPAIAPLVLRVARSFADARREDLPLVRIYQSGVFEGFIPESTWELVHSGLGELVLTDPVPGETPTNCPMSLARMREEMLNPEVNDLVAALFIGGMAGIDRELELYRLRFGDRPVYALGAPGGAARSLAHQADPDGSPFVTGQELAESRHYPALMEGIIRDIVRRLEVNGQP